MKILLVDDEVELVSTLRERLQLRGVDADYVTSAKDAMEAVENKEYDLAVLDVKMPRMSGIELKRELESRRPGMRFIFITGHGSQEDYRVGSSEGDFYLVKPVQLATLMQKAKQALGGDDDG
ncbi:response regulator [Desulfohalovibrio reitneri]|jgi:DNA-binding response OmpR family regulator|uniref:response regulator n=1 Tax=Desulfohalovibrio reitneri TaxID=1307759 RepID=UPI0004A751CA|nr:response regulator [Desulfohalovibrio reitneri]